MSNYTPYGPDDVLRPIDRVSQRLKGVKRSGDTGHRWAAYCPAHGDETQSLGVGVAPDGKVLLLCRAGCTFADVVAGLGLEQRDLFPPLGRDSRDHWQPRRDGRPPDPARTTGATKDDSAREAAKHMRLVAWWESQIPIWQTTALVCGALHDLARRLGVPSWTLPLFRLGYVEEEQSGGRVERTWIWPEPDAAGGIIGMATRDRDNDLKKFVSGGHRALTFGAYDVSRFPLGDQYTPHPEGLSDCLACAAMGLYAVGRPSNTGGVDLLAGWCAPRAPTTDRVISIVVGENDGKEKIDPKTGKTAWHEPGLKGMKKTARTLANELGRPVLMAPPPPGFKDTRAWFVARVAERGIRHDDREGVTALGREYLGLLLGAAVPVQPGEPEETNYTPEEEEILDRVFRALELSDEARPLAEAARAAVKPPQATVIDLADLDEADLAGALFDDLRIEPGRRAKGCGNVYRFRHKAEEKPDIAMSIRCCRWKCGVCLNDLKGEWTGHLTGVVRDCPKVYAWTGPAKAWPSIVKSITANAKELGPWVKHGIRCAVPP